MFKRIRSERLRLLFVAGVLAPAAMVAIGFVLGWFLRGEVLDLARRPALPAVGVAVLTAALSMGLVYTLYKSHPAFERALRDSGVKVGEEALRMAGYPVMFVVVSAAGLAEEVLFRGGLQPTIGVIPAALLFGFSHGGWRREMWAYVLAASVSGGLFGLAYLWTGDLWVPVIAHTLHNLAATIVLGNTAGEDPTGDLPEADVPIETEAEEYGIMAEPLPSETAGPPDGPEDGTPGPGEAERPV